MPEGKAEIIVKDAKVSELPESLQEDYRKKLGELKNLTKEQEKRLNQMDRLSAMIAINGQVFTILQNQAQTKQSNSVDIAHA